VNVKKLGARAKQVNTGRYAILVYLNVPIAYYDTENKRYFAVRGDDFTDAAYELRSDWIKVKEPSWCDQVHPEALLGGVQK